MDEKLPDHLQLSSKYSETQAGAGAAIGAVPGLTGFVVLSLSYRDDWGGWAVFAGFMTLVVLVLGGGIVSAGRYKTWLEGSTLVRRWIRQRRCDLAVAEVSLDTIRDDALHGPNIPRLTARDPATGTRLRLELRGNDGNLLPAAELHALADAITAAGRPETSSEARLAGQLHALADHPFSEDTL